MSTNGSTGSGFGRGAEQAEPDAAGALRRRMGESVEGFLGSVGLPTLLAWPIVLAELAGGLAILAGFYGRWVSLALLPVLLGALAIHAPNGWVFNAPNGGWEYPAFLAVAAVAHALVGDGAFALKPASLPLLSGPALTPRAA